MIPVDPIQWIIPPRGLLCVATSQVPICLSATHASVLVPMFVPIRCTPSTSLCVDACDPADQSMSSPSLPSSTHPFFPPLVPCFPSKPISLARTLSRHDVWKLQASASADLNVLPLPLPIPLPPPVPLTCLSSPPSRSIRHVHHHGQGV